MKSGIYIIRNKLNSHSYIGSSKDIEVRFGNHMSMLNSGNHHSLPLQRAWDKYGQENFEFIIVDEFYGDVTSLRLREQAYLDLYLPEYNVSKNCLNPVKSLDRFKKRPNKSKNIKRVPRSSVVKNKISIKMNLLWNDKSIKKSLLDKTSNTYVKNVQDNFSRRKGYKDVGISSSSDVLKIREIYSYGEDTCKSLGEKFGVSPATIYRIISGKTFSWVK